MSVNEEVFDSFAAFVSPGKAALLRAMGIVFPFGRRQGPYVWDEAGERRLINCHLNGGTFNLGHRNPELVRVLRDGLETHDIGNHHFPSAPRARLARSLAALTPGELAFTVFATSGGEAVDTAIKVARRATRRRRLVSIRGGYHGHTGLAVATGEPRYAEPFLVDTRDVVRIPWNDLDALRAAVTPEVAAVLVETIPATLGMPLPAPGYLAEIQARCRDTGAAYIADEVQTGMGRTGKLWAVEHWGVEPDILVTAKGLGGGLYPIAATVLTPRLAEVFRDDPFSHISTFGGADLGCLVAERVLDISSAPAFLARVTAVGDRLRAGLVELAARHAKAGLDEVRAQGAFMGLRFKSSSGTSSHQNATGSSLGGAGPLAMKSFFDAGILAFFAGNDPHVLQFLPPLLADDALVAEILDRAADALVRLGALS